MLRYILFTFPFLFFYSGLAQPSLKKTLKRFNTESVPYITVDGLQKNPNLIVLDTREREEFQVSHLRKALWVGFKEFEIGKIQKKIPDTSAPIVVYCSIGVRSEKIGEQLQNAGYTNVKNLYGGIFEWKNQGQIVVDSLENPTERVHAFSKFWGKLLTKGDKVYALK